MKTPMPMIDLESNAQDLIQLRFQWTNPITNETRAINELFSSRGIIASQGKNAGRLRASKPPINSVIEPRMRSFTDVNGNVIQFTRNFRIASLSDCATAQIWRYVAFATSPHSQHQSLPVMASFDSPFDMTLDELSAFAKWCQSVADVILSQFKITDQPGIMRWRNAMHG